MKITLNKTPYDSQKIKRLLIKCCYEYFGNDAIKWRNIKVELRKEIDDFLAMGNEKPVAQIAFDVQFLHEVALALHREKDSKQGLQVCLHIFKKNKNGKMRPFLVTSGGTKLPLADHKEVGLIMPLYA